MLTDLEVEPQAFTGPAPETLEDLRVTILGNYEGLSKRMKQVARLILDQPEDLAFETLAVVAERSSVQPSAIVRFAKTLGFSGASQMQKIIRDALLANHVTLAYGERVRQFNKTLKDGSHEVLEGLLPEYAQADILALGHLKQSIAADEISAAIERCLRADTIYIAGFRRAFPIAAYLAYSFQRSGKKTVFIEGTGGYWQQQARTIGPKDLMLAISYQPYAEETIGCVNIAAEQGADILTITDSKVSPVAKLAAQTLLVRESEVRSFRSLAASLCLAQTLVVGFAFAREGLTHKT